MKKLFVLGIGLLISVSVIGQEVVSTDEITHENTKKHSIHIEAISPFLGGFGFNYEYLNGHHGFVVEGTISSSNNSGAKSSSRMFQLAYRKHKYASFDSFFHGPFLRLTEMNTQMVYDDGLGKRFYDLKISGVVAGYNVGKKWVFDSGIGIGLRGGYGIPFLNYQWDERIEEEFGDDFNTFKQVSEVAVTLLAGFDAELSVGYSF